MSFASLGHSGVGAAGRQRPWAIPSGARELLGGAGLALALAAGVAGLADGTGPGPSSFASIETVAVAPGAKEFPAPGEFLRDGRPVAPPPRHTEFARPVEIMKYQVSVAEYRRCVEDGACGAPNLRSDAAGNLPVTGVSHIDAETYAEWYSRKTGEIWRLPTVAEWAFIAAERFSGSDNIIRFDPENPAIAWLDRYRSEAQAARGTDAAPRPAGSFGANSNGIVDLAGNVWEWTSTCYSRTTLPAAGNEAVHVVENCRVHVLEGRHRAYMSDFVSDGKSGGCAAGTPPDNLGFRLVRERPGLLDRIAARLRALIA